MKPLAIVGILSALGISAAGVLAATTPDNVAKNKVEEVIYKDVPGSLEPIRDTQPVGDRVVIVETHGLNQETQNPDGMSQASVEAHFDNINTHLEKYFPEWHGVEFYSLFKPYTWRYNCTNDVYENAKCWSQHVEANPELSKGDTLMIFIGHSMGGGESICYMDYTKKRKVLGMIGLGVPALGSWLSDKDATRQGFVDLYGNVIGHKLADRAMKGIDFNSDGIKWLKPNNSLMQPVLKRVQLDSNCYFICGKVEGSSSLVDTLWQTTSLLDVMFITKDQSQQIDVGYKLGAKLVNKISGQPNDGVVEVSSASLQGYNQNCNVIVLDGYNHSQLAKGAQGDLALYREIADALMQIYASDRNFKKAPDFELATPDPSDTALSDLNGFSPRVDLTGAQLVWVNNGALVVSEGVGSEEKTLSLPGSWSWPAWDDNAIIATKEDSGSNVVKITNDEVKYLTTDGQSKMAAVHDNGEVVLLSAGSLKVVEQGKPARTLVGGSIELDAPPMIVRDKVYYAQKAGELYNLYSIALEANNGSPKLVKGNLPSPVFKVGDQLCFMQKLDMAGDSNQKQDQKLVLISTKWFDKLPVRLTTMFSHDLFSRVDQVEMGSDGQYYLVTDGDVRWLDRSQIPSGKEINDLRLEAIKEGKRFEIVVNKDELVPVLAPGVQMDAK